MKQLGTLSSSNGDLWREWWFVLTSASWAQWEIRRPPQRERSGSWSSFTGGSDRKEGPLCLNWLPPARGFSFRGAGNFQSTVFPITAVHLCFPGVGARWVALLRGNLRGISVNAGRVINSHFLEIASWSWVQGRNNKVAPVQDFTFRDERTDCLRILSCYVLKKKKKKASQLTSFCVTVESIKGDNLQFLDQLVDFYLPWVTTFSR